MSATMYREYAAEHLGWVQTAKSDRGREILQQMPRHDLTLLPGGILRFHGLRASGNHASPHEPALIDHPTRNAGGRVSVSIELAEAAAGADTVDVAVALARC